MEIKVLAYRTQIEMLSSEGGIRRGNGWLGLVIPANPGWFWGTFMLRSGPPQTGDQPVWEADYDRMVADVPGIGHRTFVWNSTQSDIEGTESFVHSGYTRYRSSTLVLRRPAPPRPSAPPLEIRPLAGDRDWAEVLELQELVAGEKYFAGVPPFKARQMEAFRRICFQGQGQWWGAWLAGRLVADMGLFFNSGGNSRLQQVETHPGFRRRGIAAQLLHRVSVFAFGHRECRQIVIQAEAGSFGELLYARAGGITVENTVELCLEPSHTRSLRQASSGAGK